MTKLDAGLASRMARIALGHVAKEYPHKLDHVLLGDKDALPPRVLHPIFYGSFDWHSCVHGWWTLLTASASFPKSPEAEAIATWRRKLHAGESGGRIGLSRSASQPRIRAAVWLGLAAVPAPRSEMAQRALDGRARAACARVRRAASANICAILTYPIRVGTHFNTAFALVLALEWADRSRGARRS